MAIRKKIGLTFHGRAIIKADKAGIVIKPLKSSILDLAGKYRVKNPIPAEKIRDYIDYTGCYRKD